jgi:hypothetical protein
MLLDFDSSGRGACHYARSHVEDLTYRCIGTNLPVRSGGRLRACPGHYLLVP